MQEIHSIVVPESPHHTLYYSIKEAVIKNVLGKVTAMLTEYLVSSDADVKTILIVYSKHQRVIGMNGDEQNKITATEKLAIKSAIDRKEGLEKK
jgi:hypothetical protein